LERKKKSGAIDDKAKVDIVAELINYAGNDSDNDDDEEEELDGNAGDIEFIEMKQEVEDLIKKFLINSDSPFLDSVNIIVVMKCIPTQITDYSASLLNLSIL
jgi:hypothetical protein